MTLDYFVALLDGEIRRLEEVADTVLEVQKLHALRKVRALYADTPETRHSRAGRKMPPDRKRALEIAVAMLNNKTRPIRTTAILDAIAYEGITIAGHDPVNSLSAMLSYSSKFIAHGRSGWTLKPPNPAE